MIALPSYIDPEFISGLKYDHENGAMFRFYERSKPEKWKRIGATLKNGYPSFVFKNKTFYCHRVAWLLFYGSWPANEIDHINGNKLDFRICNLQDVSHQKNMENQKPRKNKHGYSGVSLRKDGRWTAKITVNNKSIQIGYFKTLEDASAAYLQAAKTVHTNNLQRFL